MKGRDGISLGRYRARMRVEATFQDKKSRGFDLEASRVRNRVHLDRLLLLLYLAIWWLARLGAACIHHGQRRRGCLEAIVATRACSGWVGNGSSRS
jgi:hypothetical protein